MGRIAVDWFGGDLDRLVFIALGGRQEGSGDPESEREGDIDILRRLQDRHLLGGAVGMGISRIPSARRHIYPAFEQDTERTKTVGMIEREGCRQVLFAMLRGKGVLPGRESDLERVRGET